MGECMKSDSKIYIAGHRGLVGSAIIKNLRERGYQNLLTRTHAELDLTDQRAVRDFFCKRAAGVCIPCGGKGRRNLG